MNTSKSRWMISTALSFSLLFGGSSVAMASANERASCFGLSFADHGPAGEVNEIVQTSQSIAQALDMPLGQLAKQFAQAHLGSHAACGG